MDENSATAQKKVCVTLLSQLIGRENLHILASTANSQCICQHTTA